MRLSLAALLLAAAPALADVRQVHLMTVDGARLTIATLDEAEDGTYSLAFDAEKFRETALAMRSFQCLVGAETQWCHVPYPYKIRRDLSDDLIDLEYDLLFVWKARGAYGFEMWNGIYYRLVVAGDRIEGALHEMDMDILSAAPAPGDLRPIGLADLRPGDPARHWLPRLVIE